MMQLENHQHEDEQLDWRIREEKVVSMQNWLKHSREEMDAAEYLMAKKSFAVQSIVFSQLSAENALHALLYDNWLHDRIEPIGIFHQHDLTDVVESLRSQISRKLGKQNVTQDELEILHGSTREMEGRGRPYWDSRCLDVRARYFLPGQPVPSSLFTREDAQIIFELSYYILDFCERKIMG